MTSTCCFWCGTSGDRHLAPVGGYHPPLERPAYTAIPSGELPYCRRATLTAAAQGEAWQGHRGDEGSLVKRAALFFFPFFTTARRRNQAVSSTRCAAICGAQEPG